MTTRSSYLADLTTEALASLVAAPSPVVALLPVGSVEPHGPHLPLSTDTIISEAAAVRASELLTDGMVALVAPPVPYGVTNYAEGFAGAITIPAATLTAFLRAIVDAYLATGLRHVCLINNHLEPEHDAAVRATLDGLPPGRASVACPLTRRWARTLTAEFKSGACHAGQYETSIVLAARPDLVRTDATESLPDVSVSLSDAIRAGQSRFAEMGMDRAYTGAPASATALEGQSTLESLADMIATEVREALDASA